MIENFHKPFEAPDCPAPARVVGPDQTHVLIIDDDRRMVELTRDYLKANGYQVSLECDGARGVDKILTLQPDLVILDVILPGEDGFSICRRVRPGYHGPVMMMTACSDDTDQVLGLEMGADDYLVKPVQPRVLLARMRALMRRAERLADPASTRLRFDDLQMDRTTREAFLADQRIDLTSAEFDLLWLLASNAGRILSRDEIFEQLRGGKYDGQDRSIDVRVSRIRPKIGDDPNYPCRVKTVRSQGYLFVRDG